MLRLIFGILDRRRIAPLFDREFYLRTNPDVAAAGVDPLRHYQDHGAAEQRQPHPLFDPAHYLGCCPQARNARNPLLHFLKERDGSWPSTHPLFDSEAYGRAHPDSAGNPLEHYAAHGPGVGLEGSQFGQC
jgi:hypothetical protein